LSDSKSGGPPGEVPPEDLANNPEPTDTFLTSTLTTAVQQARTIPSLSPSSGSNGSGPFGSSPPRVLGGGLPPPPNTPTLHAVALSSNIAQAAQPVPSRPSPVPSAPTSSRSSRPPASAAPPSAVSSAPVSASRSLQGSHVVRSRAYSFVLDAQGQPTELGSGRFAKAYLGEERWLESKTAFRRNVAIKILQKGVSEQDALRFQLEKELLERVQGHPNIITLYASGESDNPDFIPAMLRDKVENDFMILELCDMSLEERLKGSRNRGMRDDLLAYPMRERLFRVLEYMLPVASAIECAHLERNIVHRDLKPANVLLRLPSPNLQGAILDVRLADFNVGKVREDVMSLSMTRMGGVPGTLFFQSPEQETNAFELLVNVEQGSSEVDYFEDFYMYITQNDSFEIFNRHERYPVAGADRARKKLFLATPFREASETNVRAKIVKSVDRPADIYSLGAMFYYLVSGAYGNPKTLYDAFHKFIEYEKDDEQNTVEAYIEHEYEVINSLRAPKKEGDQPLVAPADRFFSYKHYLDGNGDLIDQQIMRIIAKAMIRNKPDSYCQAWDVNTTGISALVADLVQLYADYGVDASARSAVLGRFVGSTRRISPMRRWLSKWIRRAMNLRKPRLASPTNQPPSG
jgi:serine/threonine protein kinase